MKNIIWILLLIVSVSFAQNNKKNKHRNHHGHNNNYHNHYVQKPNYNFWFGMFGAFDALTGSNYYSYGWSNNTVMELHYRYVPRRDEWVLQRKNRHVSASYFLEYGKPRIVATFDNNGMGHDYSIIVHRDGYWEYDCPESLRRYFTKKVRNNIIQFR